MRNDVALLRNGFSSLARPVAFMHIPAADARNRADGEGKPVDVVVNRNDDDAKCVVEIRDVPVSRPPRRPPSRRPPRPPPVTDALNGRWHHYALTQVWRRSTIVIERRTTPDRRSSMADENRYKPLRDFAQATPEQQEAFVSWLEHAAPRPGLEELGFWCYFDLDRRKLAPAVYFGGLLENILQLANAQRDMSRDEILKIATDDISAAPENTKARFAQLLGRAMDRRRVIELSVKAGEVLWRQGRVFTDASSITQVRPVFEGTPVQVVGNAIVHEMQIEYIENGVGQRITFLMDDYRLDLLRGAIDRARAKENAIRSTAAPNTLF
jgi:hypothetical protein